MAKKGRIEREKRVTKTVEKFQSIRADLKKKSRDAKLSPAERYDALKKLQSLPRDGSATRQRNRCAETGRSRGITFLGFSRGVILRMARSGEVPGLKKSSW